jgi:hypothetical protein
MGKGTVAGGGSTGTTFNASLLSSAKATNALSLPYDGTDNTLDQSYAVSGMANLSGVSSSEAGFQLTGTGDNFIGETGTTVAGGFDASAGYYQESSLYDYIDAGYSSLGDGTSSTIHVDPTLIDLSVFNLGGGGTVLLTGASSDLFAGATLANTDSSVKLSVDGILASEAVCSFLDLCPL